MDGMRTEMPSSQIATSIRTTRFMREFAKSEDITPVGKPNKELSGIADNVLWLTSQMENENSDWLSKKRLGLSDYLGGIPEETIRDKFDTGLARSIMLQYKLLRSVSPQEVAMLHDEAYLADAIKGYTYEFILALRHAKQLGIEPSMAVRLAEKTYNHDSDTVLKLRNEFPDFEPWVITATVVNNRKPAEFLTEVKQSVARLAIQFDDFSAAELTKVAVGHPESAIDFLLSAREKIPLLQEEFPDFPRSIIRSVVLHRSDPKTFLEDVQKKMPALQKDFPSLSPSFISLALTSYPQSTVPFLKKLSETLPQFRAVYPGVNDQVLVAAVQRKDPNAYIERVQEQIGKLTLEFPEFPPNVFVSACVDYAKPRDRLVYFRQEKPKLQAEYPDLPSWVIFTSLDRYSNPRDYLNLVLARQSKLGDTFPDFAPSFILKVAVTRKNGKDLIEKIMKDLPRLKSEFPDFSRDQLIDAMEANVDYDVALKNARDNLPIYKQKYAQFPNWVIKKALLANTDPDEYLLAIQKNLQAAQKMFPEFNPSIHLDAVIRDPDDCLGHLARVREAIPALREHFPHLDLWVIQKAAIKNPQISVAVGRITAALVLFDVLRQKYPDATERSLYYAALDRPNKPDSLIKEWHSEME